MTGPTRTKTAVAVVAALAVLVAMAGLAESASIKVTKRGVGPVGLGDHWNDLNDAGLAGPRRQGCELSGPNERVTRLRIGTRATARLSRNRPRRVETILVTGRRARARGVGVGSPIGRIKDAFPGATVNPTTVRTFGIKIVNVPRNAGGRIQFAIDADTNRATTVAVPHLLFCE